MGRHHRPGTTLHASLGIPEPRRAPDTVSTGRHRAVRPARHRLENPHDHERVEREHAEPEHADR